MDSSTMKSGALVLTDEVGFSVRAVRDLGIDGASFDDAVVITQCGSLGGKLPFGAASFDSVLAVLRSPESSGELWLGEIGRVLKSEGQIIVQTYLASTSLDKPSNTLERKLLLSGFVEIQAFAPAQDGQSVTIKGKKASWTMGSSFPLRKEAKILPRVQIDDESDLIDEDSLLTEEDLMKPQVPIVGDCEVGSTRKACKNCTCGRAEEEQKVQKLGLTAEQIDNPQSACGNCGLGDAFRCGGCPYKGLPPFKLGEKVSLSGNFLAADI
ncbi:Anamorsin [Ananas comosus]|uniref:Anamorsin homolog n=1 Tax=Ananas comosus TaxID=4615 RepID=A0A199ULN2_ANACO|nr:Anamorsin [Ananas comosus]